MGLMFRESLPERAGMVFLFGDGAAHPFWMKNTMIPLDMIWLDADGRVLFISADTPPCKADPCPSYGPATPAANVLEIAGGLAKKEKIEVGSVLMFADVNDRRLPVILSEAKDLLPLSTQGTTGAGSSSLRSSE